MRKNKIFFGLTLILFLFLIQSTFALNVYVRPAKIIAHMNVTPGQVSTYNSFLEVKNQNNISVNVTLRPTGNITNKLTLSEGLVKLEPNETRKIDFVISTNEPGRFDGGVIVTYLANNTLGISLQAEIIIMAQKVESPNSTVTPTTTPEEQGKSPLTGLFVFAESYPWVLVIIAIVIIVVLIAAFIIKKRH
jgi:hypothetical protein